MNDARAPRALLIGTAGLASGLPQALEALGADGPVAIVSAGWQEREGSHERLGGVVSCPLVDLRIYARAASVLETDVRLRSVLRERQMRVRALQADYRVRLTHAAAAARALSDGRSALPGADGHRRDALTGLRALDRRHLQRLAAVHAEPVPFSEALAREKERVQSDLAGCAAVLVAGGHAAVLRNRIRLLGLDAELRRHVLVAWGAGAMVCTDRMVLFLDHSPRGPREPEILDAGVGAVRGVVALPGARIRLALGDRDRIGLTARRFAPARCVALDDDAALHFQAGRLVRASGVFRLAASGKTPRVRVA